MARVDINKLANKKKLTGTDVGRLMLKDLCHTYHNMKNPGANKRVLSEAEKEEFFGRITTTAEGKIYNDLLEVHKLLLELPGTFEVNRAEAVDNLWRVYHLFSLSNTVEGYYRNETENSPVIMTEGEYERYRKKQQEKNKTRDSTIEELFFRIIRFYVGQHEGGEKTPLDPIFEAEKKRTVDNPRLYKRKFGIISSWGKARKGDPAIENLQRVAKKGDTAYDILASEAFENCYKALLNSFNKKMEFDEEMGYRSFSEVRSDFPDLYNAVMDEIQSLSKLEGLKKCKALKALDKLTVAQICSTTEENDAHRIPFLPLYEGDLYGIRHYLDSVKFPDPLAMGGIAVLKESAQSRSDIDHEKDMYIPYDDSFLKAYGVESVLRLTDDGTATTAIMIAIRDIYICNTINFIVEEIAKTLDIPEIAEEFVRPTDFELAFLEQLNLQMASLPSLYRFKKDRSGLDTEKMEKLSEQIKARFPVLDLDKCQALYDPKGKDAESAMKIRDILNTRIGQIYTSFRPLLKKEGKVWEVEPHD